jgi:hypothetical protein
LAPSAATVHTSFYSSLPRTSRVSYFGSLFPLCALGSHLHSFICWIPSTKERPTFPVHDIEGIRLVPGEWALGVANADSVLAPYIA